MKNVYITTDELYTMKKSIFLFISLCLAIMANAQEKKATIEFDRTTIDLGKFGQENPIQKCFFIFRNTCEKNLYIHQIMTSCGCTDKKFPTHAIAPGESDTIFITYNGEGKSPRKFRTNITVHSNGTPEMMKLYIKGEMLPAKIKENEVIIVDE